MRECKGMCSRFDRVSFGFGKKIYTDGVRYCKTCSRMMKIDGYKCTCCKSSVRSKSHTRKWRDSQRGLAI
jgi:hypothetical protein